MRWAYLAAASGAAATLMSSAAMAQVPAGLPPEAAVAAATPGPRPLSEGVAAVVNDDVITTYDLRERVLLILVTNGVQPTEANLREIEREALRALVDEKLEAQEIKHIQQKNKDVHLEPTPKELNEEIAELSQQYGVKPDAFLATLKTAGVDPETLLSQLRIQLAWRHYIGGRFGSAIRIGDDRVTQEQARAALAASKPQYQVGEIFIDSARVGGQPQAEQGAAQLIAQIKKGAPFAAVARQFSSLPSAANGGDAGWLATGQINPPQLEVVLATMRPGQLSDPIPVSDGVYVLQLRDKRSGVGANMVDLKQAAVRLSPDATPEQLAAASVKLDAVRATYKDCATFDANAGKVGGVVAGDLGETEIGELSPEFKVVVDTLKVGEIGGPVRTKAGLHLIAVCGRRSSDSSVPTKDAIEGRLENEQLSMIAKRFLRDLRNSATIESR